jgi:ATP-dependent Clp protease ATP-binding subunit ClpA
MQFLREQYFGPEVEGITYMHGLGEVMTGRARRGEYSPLVGRDDEVNQLVTILSRKTKSNPVLLGEAGVGKTAVVEGLAKRLVSEDVPEGLRGCSLVSLSLVAVVSDTKYRGQMEARVGRVIRDVKRANREGVKKVLFVDEIHSLVGAGETGGSASVGNLLKPALARGKFKCIGATTLVEYAKYFEGDGAMERRFQPVKISAPSLHKTFIILSGLWSLLEAYHKVRILPTAIYDAANFSDRYITDRNQPDKGIDVLDEACSRVKFSVVQKPKRIQILEHQLNEVDKKILDEEACFRMSLKEFDNLLQTRRILLIKVDAINFLWQKRDEKSAEPTRFGVKFTSIYLKTYLKKGEYRREPWWAQDGIEDRAYDPLDYPFLNPQVTSMVVGGVVSDWVGVPAAEVTQEEKRRLVRLSDDLANCLVGQNLAISTVTKALKRSRLGFSDPKRPIATFFFVGPTGVGKTQLARLVSDYFFGGSDSLHRFDMSEFSESHSVSKLLGSPPGYVGHDEGGRLSDLIRREPYSLVLFDEVEKANPVVYDVFLGILEDGVVADGKGRMCYFHNALIVMTSNVGSEMASDGKIVNVSDIKRSRNKGRQMNIFDSGLGTDQISNSSVFDQPLSDDYIKKDQGNKTKDQFGNSDLNGPKKLLNQFHFSVLEERRKAWVDYKMLKIFRPEFINRMDSIIIFSFLDRVDVRKVCDVKLREAKKDTKAGSGIDFAVDERFKIKLTASGFDPDYGARPMRRSITENLVDALPSLILKGLVGSNLGCLMISASPTRIDRRYQHWHQQLADKAKKRHWDNNRVKFKEGFILIREWDPKSGSVKGLPNPRKWDRRYCLW